jgi:hypothetical protein
LLEHPIVPSPRLVASIVATAACAALTAQPVRAEPIGTIEARVGGGMAIGGGEGASTIKIAPVYVGVYANHAFNAEPWTWIRGGVFIETYDRAAVGATLGPRVALGKWTAGAAATAVFAPFTLYGGNAQVARRFGKLVPALELNVFPFGDDLPDGRVVSELLLTIGFEVDAW